MQVWSISKRAPALIVLFALLMAALPFASGIAPARAAGTISATPLTISPSAVAPLGTFSIGGCGWQQSGETLSVGLVSPNNPSVVLYVSAAPNSTIVAPNGCIGTVNNTFVVPAGATPNNYLVRVDGVNQTAFGALAVAGNTSALLNINGVPGYATTTSTSFLNVSGTFPAGTGTATLSLRRANSPGVALQPSQTVTLAADGSFTNFSFPVNNFFAGTYYLVAENGTVPGAGTIFRIGTVVITGTPTPNPSLTFTNTAPTSGTSDSVILCGLTNAADATLPVTLNFALSNTTITSVVATPQGQYNNSGCYSYSFVVPQVNTTATTYAVTATTTNGQVFSGTLLINPSTINNTLSFAYNPVQAGATEQATGCGFSLGNTITLTFVLNGITYSTSTVASNLTYVNSTTCYTFTFIVPQLQAGTYTVSASNGLGTIDTGTLTISSYNNCYYNGYNGYNNNYNFCPGFYSLAISPNPASVGTTVTGSGCGYVAGDTITLQFSSSLGSVIASPYIASSPSYTSGSGCYSFTFVVPYVPAGTYSVSATGSISHNVDVGSLTVSNGTTINGPPLIITGPYFPPTTTTLLATPATVAPGQATTLQGSGFTAGQSVTISGLGTSITIGDPNGSFSTTFTVPAGTARGTYTISASDTVGRTTSTTISVSQTGVSLVASVSSTVNGQLVTVSGNGFGAGEQVSLSLAAISSTPFAIGGTIQVYTADANGSFSVSYTVPNVAAGSYLLLGLGQTSRIQAVTSFNVLPTTIIGTPGQPTATPVPPVVVPATPVVTLPTLPSVGNASTTTYFADGYTGTAASNGKATFTERIYLYNPSSIASTVNTSYAVLNAATNTRTTVTEQDVVPAGSTVVRTVNNDVGNDRQVSVKVQASSGIVAEEVITRQGADGSTLDAASTRGSSRPDSTWYFAEGYTGESLQEYITLYNPGTQPANAQIHYLPSDGASIAAQPVSVPAGGQVTVNVRSQYNQLAPRGSKNIAAEVTSDQPVVVDRAMYWGDGAGSGKFGYDLAPGLTSGARTQYFAYLATSGGSQSFVTVLNPSSSSSTVTLNLVNNSGGSLKSVSAEVGANQRYTFVVPNLLPGEYGAVAGALVSSSTPVVSEVGVYFGGSPNIGLHPGIVVQGSAGTQIGARAYVNSRGGQLKIYNPKSSSVRIQISLGGTDGSVTVFDGSLAGNSSKLITLPAGTGSRGVLVLSSDSVASVLVNGGIGSATAWGGTLN